MFHDQPSLSAGEGCGPISGSPDCCYSPCRSHLNRCLLQPEACLPFLSTHPWSVTALLIFTSFFLYPLPCSSQSNPPISCLARTAGGEFRPAAFLGAPAGCRTLDGHIPNIALAHSHSPYPGKPLELSHCSPNCPCITVRDPPRALLERPWPKQLLMLPFMPKFRTP